MLMHRPSQALHFSQYVKIRKCSVCAETLSQVNTFSFKGHHLFPSRSPPSLTWAKSIWDCTSSHPYRWPHPPSFHTHIMLMHRPSKALHFSQWIKIRKCSVCAETLSKVTTFAFRGHYLFPTRSPPCLTWAKSICDCTSSHPYRWVHPPSLHT